MGRPPAWSKEGGEGVPNECLLDLMSADLDFFTVILDLSRVNLDFFCWIADKTDFALVSICRIDDEINKSVFHFTDLKVQAHGHKVETSRFQDRHHPMKGSHVHRTQRRFLLITGTGKI